MLPRSLIKYRETGILRRLSVTPVPPAWLLAAQIVINLAIAVAGLIILTAAGVAAFGLELPKNFLGFLLAYLLTVTSLFAVGLCIAAFVRNDAVAQGIGGILFFALLFFGGMWIPRPLMPPVLTQYQQLDAAWRIGRCNPKGNARVVPFAAIHLGTDCLHAGFWLSGGALF